MIDSAATVLPEATESRDSTGDLDASEGVPPNLLNRVQKCLDDNLENRQLSLDTQAAWQIFHGILAYGRDFTIVTPTGRQAAVEFILAGGPVNGFTPRAGDRFEVASADGSIESSGPRVRRGLRFDVDPGSKRGPGHRDQWLAYLTRCDLPLDQEIVTSAGTFEVADWLRQIEWDVPMNFEREYSWTLVALSTYRDTRFRWVARDGNSYSIESLLRSEIDLLSPSSACGGSHRLAAIATLLRRHQAAGHAVTGVWADAASLTEMAIQQAREFQNADGTFSASFFERPDWSLDLSATLGTSGHVLEFIALAADDETLSEPWVSRAVEAVCDSLERTAHLDLECGALYHALAGLSVYHHRVSLLHGHD